MENDDNIQPTFLIPIVNNELMENTINEKTNEIMTYAYENMMKNADNDNIIKFIDYCYLKNLQYDDQVIDTIRYTIRSILIEGSNEFDLKVLCSNILEYSLSDKNHTFNDNFEYINDILLNELKRFLRQSLSIIILNNIFNSNNNMEDVKLILSEEELNKIPTNTFKNIDNNLKDSSNINKCSICQDNYNDNDNVKILKCKHIYHSDCIDNWLGNHSHKCPYCRESAGEYIAKT